MGTRADFYIGRGEASEWLGSIAWDGDPGCIDKDIMAAKDADTFRERLTVWLKSRDDATFPEQGWPWPWENSSGTDYAYALDDGSVWVSNYGCQWRSQSQMTRRLQMEREVYQWQRAHVDGQAPCDDQGNRIRKPRSPRKIGSATFPDMVEMQNVTLGPRSGVLVF